jgi:hypothetical protein
MRLYCRCGTHFAVAFQELPATYRSRYGLTCAILGTFCATDSPTLALSCSPSFWSLSAHCVRAGWRAIATAAAIHFRNKSCEFRAAQIAEATDACGRRHKLLADGRDFYPAPLLSAMQAVGLAHNQQGVQARGLYPVRRVSIHAASAESDSSMRCE